MGVEWQVSLAIPEQLWGVISFLTSKKGPPEEYEFKMTKKELDAANEKGPSFKEKLAAAKELLADYRRLRPQLKERNAKALLRELLFRPKFASNIDMLFPSVIPEFFKTQIFGETVRSLLNDSFAEFDSYSAEANHIKNLLENEWETSGDLRNGVMSIQELKNLLGSGDCYVVFTEYWIQKFC